MGKTSSREIRLKNRPTGMVTENDFELVEVEIPEKSQLVGKTVQEADELATVLDRRPTWIEHVNGVRFRALPGEPRFTTRLQLEREAAVLTAGNTPSPVAADALIVLNE